MTVQELIDKLSGYNKNNEVIIYDISNSWGNQINDVYENEQVCIEIGQLC